MADPEVNRGGAGDFDEVTSLVKRDDQIGLGRNDFLGAGVLDGVIFAGEGVEVEDDVEGFVDEFFVGLEGFDEGTFVTGDEVVPVIMDHLPGEAFRFGVSVAELEIEAIAEVGSPDTGGVARAKGFEDGFGVFEAGLAVEGGVFDSAGEVATVVD